MGQEFGKIGLRLKQCILINIKCFAIPISEF